MLSVSLATTCFASAKELLECQLHDMPGCLVLDVRLPELSCFDFQHQLALGGYATPIIILTTHGAFR